MIQLFKDAFSNAKEYYNEMIIPYWNDVKECFKEFVIWFKS